MSCCHMGLRLVRQDMKKQFVLVRTEKEGIPVYYVASLLEVPEFGGTDSYIKVRPKQRF